MPTDYRFTQTYGELQRGADRIEGMFVAEYGTTTFAEITAAKNAGQVVLCDKDGVLYGYVKDFAQYHVFACIDDTTSFDIQSGITYDPNYERIAVSNLDVWSAITLPLAKNDSPALTGNPTAPTQPANDNSTKIATTGYVDRVVYDSLMEDSVGPAPIVSFPDGAQNVPVAELTSSIEPIQDLHGQASPYPPNGGKNKLGTLLASIKSLNTSGTWSGNSYTLNDVTFACKSQDGYLTSITINGTASANTYFIIADQNTWTVLPAGDYTVSGCPSGGSDSTYCIVAQFNDGSSQRTIYDTGTSATITASTDLSFVGTRRCNFFVGRGVEVSNKECKPMVCLSSATDPTVFTPYSNECPIEGYTGAEITRTGKQLFDKTATDPAKGYENDYALAASGSKIASVSDIITEYIPVKPNTQYTLQGVAGNIASICAYDSEKNYLSGANYGGASTKTITTPNNAAFVRFSCYKPNLGIIQLEEGTTASPYEAFGTVYSVSWTDEGTVYKGTREYLGGGEWKVTPTHAGIDLSTISWTRQTTWKAWITTSITNFKRPVSASTPFDGISEKYKVADMNSLLTNLTLIAAAHSEASDTFAIRTEAEDVTPTGLLVYPLASPTSFTVTGPTPETLLGDNNIWSDTGDISVKYRCNTALYIEKKLG